MGNYRSKQDSESSDLLISRCPRRNRFISDIGQKDIKDKESEKKGKDSKETNDSFNIFSCNEYIQNFNAENVKLVKYLEQQAKLCNKKRKRQLKRTQNLEDENLSEIEYLEQRTKFQTNKKKRRKRNRREEENSKQIFNILETVADLEEILLEEKKYERRIFKAIEEQIQELQRLSLLLDKERGQNKKLMCLLDCCDEKFEADMSAGHNGNFENSLYRTDRQSFLTKTYSESLSPMLLQQKCDELSNSLARCKIELSNKNKEYLVTQYKLDEWQNKCETLTKELQRANDRIEILNQEIVFLKKEKKLRKKSLKLSACDENTYNCGASGNLMNKTDEFGKIECQKNENILEKKTIIVAKAKAD